MFVVIHGNPADGFGYIGPFPDGEAANDYADTALRGEDWWVVALQSPAQEDASDIEAARRAQDAGEYVSLDEALGDA